MKERSSNELKKLQVSLAYVFPTDAMLLQRCMTLNTGCSKVLLIQMVYQKCVWLLGTYEMGRHCRSIYPDFFHLLLTSQ